MMFAMMSMAPLMIALTLGYLVLVKAKKEETPFKILGYGIGVLVIAISASMVISQLIMYFAPDERAQCGIMGKNKKMICKDTMMGKGKMMMQQPPVTQSREQQPSEPPQAQPVAQPSEQQPPVQQQ